VDPSGLNSEYTYGEMGYDATRHVAEAVDTITFGATGWIAERINTVIYGKDTAESTTIEIRYKDEFEKRLEQIEQDLKSEAQTSNASNGFTVLGQGNEDGADDTCEKCKEECEKPPVVAPTEGNCEYYKKRYASFIKRFEKCKGCGSYTPPDYYLNYGYKYCTQFMEDTYSKMTPAGKDWIKRTLYRLQLKMEEGLKYTNECDNMAMRKMAFDSHVPAYNPKEMSNLPLSDLSKIGITPDHEEWWGSGSGMTWQQAWDVAKDVDYGKVYDATKKDWGW